MKLYHCHKQMEKFLTIPVLFLSVVIASVMILDPISKLVLGMCDVVDMVMPVLIVD